MVCCFAVKVKLALRVTRDGEGGGSGDVGGDVGGDTCAAARVSAS